MEEYISLNDAAERIGVTVNTLHYYLRALKLKTTKFPLDRRHYLTMQEFELIQKLKEQVGKPGPKAGHRHENVTA